MHIHQSKRLSLYANYMKVISNNLPFKIAKPKMSPNIKCNFMFAFGVLQY